MEQNYEQFLPPELRSEILSHLSGPSLIAACQSSPEYRSLCSKDSFWLNIFTGEGLPLLESGENLSQWISIYRKSRKANSDAQRLLAEHLVFTVPLYKGINPSVLVTGPLTLPIIQEFLDKLSNNPRYYFTRNFSFFDGEEQDVIETGRLVIYRDFPPPRYIYRLEIGERYIFHPSISAEDAAYLLYKLCYYGILAQKQIK